MIQKEIRTFLVVGTLTVCVDFLFYQLFLRSEFLPVPLAKALGFIAGTVFAYFANRYWTFQHRSPTAQSVVRFYVLYGLTLLVNVMTNALIIKALPNVDVAVHLAFIVATGLSAILNFVGLKMFVFNQIKQE